MTGGKKVLAKSPDAKANRLPPIVEAMMRPGFYPDHPATVDLLQTHISYVFLAGKDVYKLKKAVRFSFIDCADISQRRHLCLEEMRLNRRLAPDVYLGVYAITRAGDNFALGDQAVEPSRALDYVIKMRRLPNEEMLDRRLSRGQVDTTTIRAVASIIVDFHRATSSAHAAQYGTASELWRVIVGEIIEMERLVGLALTAKQFSVIGSYCRGFIRSHWQRLNARVDAGHVREGHGDLRCEHICIEGDKVSIFDCVEFSERLRTCDLASEVSFLAMDLDRLGATELADELVITVTESTNDADLPLLMPFYKCYRAVVRGVVESLRSREPEVDDSERRSSIVLAAQYFSLAYSYAIGTAPAVLAVCGLSGTGKSTVARALHYRLGLPIISSDHIRKRLGSVPAKTHLAGNYNAGIYSDASTESTYAEILEEAGHILKEGGGVILDATFQKIAHRKAALDLAARSEVPVLFIECRADDVEIRRRLHERQQRGQNASDATVEVYLRQRQEFAALSEICESNHLIVNTARPLSHIVADVKKAIESLNH